MRRPIIPYDAKLKERARSLRNNSTRSEILLWKALKGKQLQGYDFDRQRPIGHYIVDFYCKALKLAIEVDGDSHIGKEFADKKRQEYIEEQGVRFLRFQNAEVKNSLEIVVKTIEDWIDSNPPTPSPSKGGE